MGGKLWGGLKAGAVGAGVAIGGILTGSIVKGFNRLKDIENAEAKLSGLGHSAGDVQKIMDNALAAVKGTAYGMDEAASAAASAVAAGVEPGKELEKYLSLVGDTAAIAGVEFNDMGAIFGKVMTSGKVQGDIFNQLSDAGIPVVQMLSDELGVAAEDVYKMGSAGEITSDQFLSAMGSMEGSALKLGGTTEGAWKNMGAAMGRFGATLLKDVYPLIGPLLGRVTELFDYLSDAAGPAIESLIGKFKEWAASDGVQSFLGGVRDVAVALYERALKPLGKWIGDNWQVIATFLGGIVAFFVGGALVSAIGAVGAAIGGFVGALNFVAIGIAAAVGAIVTFFTQTETGRKMLDGFVSFIRDTLVPGIVTGFGLVRDFVVNELWPMIKSRFEAIRDLAVQVWQGVIQPAFEQFAGFIRETVMPIIQRLWTEYVQPAFLAIGALAVWLWNNAIKPAMGAIDTFISTVLGPAIVWLWESVVSPIFGLIGRFIGWVWNTLIFPYLDAMKYHFTVVVPAAAKLLWEGIKWAWNAISGTISAVIGWITGTAVPSIQTAWTMISNGAKWLWGAIKAAWNGIMGAIRAVVSWMQTWVWPVIEMVIALIKVGFNALRDTLSAVWKWIKDKVIAPVVAWFRDTVWPIIQNVIGMIKTAFNVMRDSLGAAWSWVKDKVIAPVIAWFRDTAWSILKSAIDKVKNAFNVMRDSLKAAWNFVKDKVIAPVANWFRDTVEPLLKRSTDKTGDAFTTMKDTIKAAWEGVKKAAKAPIKFVVDTVINGALIKNFNKLAEKLGTSKLPEVSLPKGFARGGVLPGMSSMRDGDDQLVPMRRGEGVLVSEGLRTAKDRSAFMAANAAGRRGVGFASLMGGGFAGGGILGKAWNGAKDWAGDALDTVLDGADFVAEAIKDPKSILTKLYDEVTKGFPGAGVMLDAAKGAGTKLLNGIIGKADGDVGSTFNMDAVTGKISGAVKAGGGLGTAQRIARSFGLTMTSHRRGGARTAGNGSVSLHAMGRAMDFSNSGGPTPQMMSFFNAMLPYRPTELLYTPAGSRNLHRSGRQYANTGATKRGHYNHVHVGFNEGGIFDQGGLMQPGMTGINLTKKPEAVLDPKQTRAYQVHAAAITDGAMDLSATSIEALAEALASRPNVVRIGNRDLSSAVTRANRAMGVA